MSIDAMLLATFMTYFEGNKQSFGEHTYSFSEDGKKEEGTNQTITNVLLTQTIWADHLNGKKGLGIVPINEKNECHFGVIDIDVYDKTTVKFLEAIDNNNLPLVPFKTKSGGLHLYMFLSNAAPANIVREIMSDFVVLLGIDFYVKSKIGHTVEIFPKQSQLTAEAKGSWINLPYYNVAKATRQYAIVNGKELSLSDALNHIRNKRTTQSAVKEFLKDIRFMDGPPCLRTITLLNDVGKGARNNYLFSVAVYLKKKDDNFWEQELFSINEALKQPLSRDELEGTIISSLRKKDYIYKCTDIPCVDYCRKQLCKKAKYGVGKEDGYFSDIEFGKIVQIKIEPPYYEWQIKINGDKEFVPLRFRNESEIIQQDVFMELCLRELHVLPPKMKQSEWAKIINQAFSEIEIKTVDRDEDISYMTIFRSLFLDFLTRRAKAKKRDQIPQKRVFYDDEVKTYFFRVQDLTEYLFTDRNFRYIGPGELHGVMRDIKAVPTRIRTETNKQLRVYMITRNDALKLGDIIEDTFEADFAALSEKETF